MEVANAIVKSIGTYHLVRYEVGVCYLECPLLEVLLYIHTMYIWINTCTHVNLPVSTSHAGSPSPRRSDSTVGSCWWSDLHHCYTETGDHCRWSLR